MRRIIKISLVLGILIIAGGAALLLTHNSKNHTAKTLSPSSPLDASRITQHPTQYNNQTVSLVGSLFQTTDGYYLGGFDQSHKVIKLDIATNHVDTTKLRGAPTQQKLPIDGAPYISGQITGIKGRVTVTGVIHDTNGQKNPSMTVTYITQYYKVIKKK